MTSITTRIIGLGLFALFLLGCPPEEDENRSSTNQEEPTLSYYEQCVQFIEETFQWWQDGGCIDDDGQGSASIVAREEAGDDYDGVGKFSLLFGANREEEECYNSSHLSYQSNTLQLAHAGAQNGHIIDLGADASYEEISWGRTAADLGVEVDSHELDALFYAIEDEEPQIIVDRIELHEGHSYLLRSSTEEYDLYAKLHVTTYDAGELVEFDYEVLHIEDAEVLCQRRDDAYQDWTNNPADEVTLYDRSTYNDYVKATFSVEMGTRDLVWETRNNWQLSFEGDELRLLSGGEIADLGDVELADVADLIDEPEDDLPFEDYQPVVLDHTYYADDTIPFAFRVLEYEADDFVTFQWMVLD